MHPGDVVSYIEMCADLGVNLQRGMNFHLRENTSVILMSLRAGAPYADRVEDGGTVLIYEGHDIARTEGSPDPKKVDQPATFPSGRLTQNGLFLDAVARYKNGECEAEQVRVYEKIRAGIWVYNGLFRLTDAFQESARGRQVFKFRLEKAEDLEPTPPIRAGAPEHDRIIPSAVKLEAWKRDKGKCAACGAASNLHFDHIIPYSQGGSSKDAKNIQILCAKHNLAKHDSIM
ncbi:MAG TPA: HNH endonuclease [Terriglobales bacterium]